MKIAVTPQVSEHPEVSGDGYLHALRGVLADLLGDGGERVERLAEAGTTVEVRRRLATDAQDPFVLLLDRVPPCVAEASEPAEIVLELDDRQLALFSRGLLSVQEEMMVGSLSYSGPIRRLLDVSAVLMGLLSERDGSLEPIPNRPDATTEQVRAPTDVWAIEVRDLRKRLGGSEVLKGIELGIPEGMITAIVGPSGTGKSVLLKHFIGLLRPDSGDVLVRGRALARMSLRDLGELRKHCGVLFQDGALWGSMTIYDNVALPLRQHTNLSERQIEDVVTAGLARVGLADAAGLMPSQLSGGMRKRAGFARALVLDPSLLLFDEPDSGLDPVRTALLCDLIAQTHTELGGTYVVITHDIRAARRIADHMVVMRAGSVVAMGPTSEVLASTDPYVQQFLEGAVDGPLGMD